MARAIADIEQDILALSEEDRLALLRVLIADLDGPPDADVDRSWLDEAERRDRELESGAVASIPADDVFREARALLRR
jgi:hypothetical protein